MVRVRLPKKGKPQIGDAGRASESLLAKAIKAKLTPNSGAVAGVKGDMALGDFLLESKSTVGKSIGVQHSWLSKISKEARDQDKTPALTLSYTGTTGKPTPHGEWVCVPLPVFMRMVEALREVD